MSQIWYPNFCPGKQSDSCAIEATPGQTALVKFHRLCEFHRSLRGQGLADSDVFTIIRQATSEKEAARARVAEVLGLKGNADVPFRVESDGTIVIEASFITTSPTAKMLIDDDMVKRPLGLTGRTRIVIE